MQRAAGGGAGPAGQSGGMAVEIKLRLGGAEAHAQVGELVRAAFVAKYHQENYFFDGAEQELSSRRVVLRVRFYNGDERAVVTVKGKSIITEGVGRASEEEEDVDPALARKVLADPAALLAAGIPLVDKVAAAYGVAAFDALGGFKNVRDVFTWEGHELELDETQYDWGTLYELECETEEPDALKPKLEGLLRAHGVAFKYSTTSKFANFRNKTLE